MNNLKTNIFENSLSRLITSQPRNLHPEHVQFPDELWLTTYTYFFGGKLFPLHLVLVEGEGRETPFPGHRYPEEQ